jgi:hypothetical protein
VITNRAARLPSLRRQVTSELSRWSRSLATLAAIRRASSLLSSLAADRYTG